MKEHKNPQASSGYSFLHHALCSHTPRPSVASIAHPVRVVKKIQMEFQWGLSEPKQPTGFPLQRDGRGCTTPDLPVGTVLPGQELGLSTQSFSAVSTRMMERLKDFIRNTES